MDGKTIDDIILNMIVEAVQSLGNLVGLHGNRMGILFLGVGILGHTRQGVESVVVDDGRGLDDGARRDATTLGLAASCHVDS